ncbi:protease inhibitor I42 family protein [Calothrix sp. NIES-2098]|uniref:protease inhibitor I42 family protein n=1 Tax=Calothrix sp. NIES-2098 TaxID=1954171 RepID=UPI000B61E379|nr:hypothetical protein NIES2098_25500 [Calothrix sp. NIES-2098]
MFPALIITTYLVSCIPQAPKTTPNNQTSLPPVVTPSLRSPKLPLKSGMSEVTLSQADNGKIITLKRGQILKLRLDENPTTGYRWSMSVPDSQVLQLNSDNFNQPSNAGIGAGGQRVFAFHANNPGKAKLQMKKLREWIGEQSTIEQFEVTVQVTE